MDIPVHTFSYAAIGGFILVYQAPQFCDSRMHVPYSEKDV